MLQEVTGHLNMGLGNCIYSGKTSRQSSVSSKEKEDLELETENAILLLGSTVNVGITNQTSIIQWVNLFDQHKIWFGCGSFP